MDNRIDESSAPEYYRKPMPLEIDIARSRELCDDHAPNAETVAALEEDVSGARRFDSAKQLFAHLKGEIERELREEAQHPGNRP